MSVFGFIHQAISNFRNVGAVAGSSRFLVRRMLLPVDFRSNLNIVELGPGSGNFTRSILKNMNAQSRLTAYEINDAFFHLLQQQIQDKRCSLKHQSATELLQSFAPGTVDVVVSSVPLAMMPSEVKYGILEASAAVLKPGGLFLQYQYSRSDLKLVRRYFPNMKTTFALLNLPPAIIYMGRKSQ
jgi:phosphatidylethanolamine/phosphatidyl-N-methylethanolamine N-methyltransferase